MPITQLVACVVEWGDLDGPSLLIATDMETATRRLMDEINRFDQALTGGLVAHDSTPEGFWREHPAPTDSAPLKDIDDWLDSYHCHGKLPLWSWHYIDLTPYIPPAGGVTLQVSDPGDVATGNVLPADVTKTYGSDGSLLTMAEHYDSSQKASDPGDVVTGNIEHVISTMQATLRERMIEPHEYERGETTHRMHTDPDCSTCGKPQDPQHASHSEEL